MCQSNMAHNILKIGVNVFKSEKHLMLAPFYYILERLSSHAITPSDLRLVSLKGPYCHFIFVTGIPACYKFLKHLQHLLHYLGIKI